MISRIQKNAALLFRIAINQIGILNTIFFFLVDLLSENQSEKTWASLHTLFPARMDVDGLGHLGWDLNYPVFPGGQIYWLF